MNATTTEAGTTHHAVVSRAQWTEARRALLEREKELTRLGDQIARERRALPWVRVEKDYVFDTPDGPRALADLFEGRSQLLVQHFMFAPGREQGCPSCSYMADHNDGAAPHLAARDVTLLVVSRNALPEIERFRERMGWRFKWVSSARNDFNHDFHVSFTPEEFASGSVYYNFAMQPFPQAEAPGISVFHKDAAGQVFHTYSRYGRGVEVMMGAYPLIDLVPKGRDEEGLEHTMAWVRHHDRYESRPAAHACCGSRG